MPRPPTLLYEFRMASGAYDSRRLESFSDAVMAVAITLMVLRINPPTTRPGTTLGEEFMNETVPAIVFFLITFAVIVLLWRHHHDVFTRLPAKIGPRSFGINMAFLAAVCLLPFGLEFFTNEPTSMLTVGVYAGLMSIATVLLSALSAATVGRWESDDLIRAGVFLLAIPLAPVMGGWSLLIWWLNWPVSIMVRRLGERRRRRVA